MNVMNMPNVAFLLLIAVAAFAVASAFSPSLPHQFPPLLLSSPLQSDTQTCLRAEVEDDDVSLEAFQARKRRNEEQNSKDDLEEFDGYAMRDVILEKWGKCFDVDFNRVDSFGFKNLYLNVVPFHLGGRRFRHETELDYLCHLQAVVEVLQKYDQVRDLMGRTNVFL